MCFEYFFLPFLIETIIPYKSSSSNNSCTFTLSPLDMKLTSYKTNDQFESSNEGTMRAIGIDIPDTSARNKLEPIFAITLIL